MTVDPDRTALRLFYANHADADPLLIARKWEDDPEPRAFWVRQVRIVLEVDE